MGSYRRIIQPINSVTTVIIQTTGLTGLPRPPRIAARILRRCFGRDRCLRFRLMSHLIGEQAWLDRGFVPVWSGPTDLVSLLVTSNFAVIHQGPQTVRLYDR